MTRAGCPARFYCPSGTYGALDQNLTKITGVETSLSIDQELVNQVVCGSKPGESTVTSACPTGKASPFPLLIIIKPAGPGKPVSDSIEIQMDTVTRKPIYVVDDNGDKQTVQLTGVWNQVLLRPCLFHFDPLIFLSLFKRLNFVARPGPCQTDKKSSMSQISVCEAPTATPSLPPSKNVSQPRIPTPISLTRLPGIRPSMSRKHCNLVSSCLRISTVIRDLVRIISSFILWSTVVALLKLVV
jgi:hypothetical protein